MATFNQVTFIGRLGKDPDMSYTPTGKPVTKFSMAVDQGKEQKPMWLNISCWNELAERMNSFLYKGALVFVQGRLQLRTYADKSNIERQALEVVAQAVQVLEKTRPAMSTPSSDAVEDNEETPF
jgi:single-strand DNA-binding protein